MKTITSAEKIAVVFKQLRIIAILIIFVTLPLLFFIGKDTVRMSTRLQEPHLFIIIYIFHCLSFLTLLFMLLRTGALFLKPNLSPHNVFKAIRNLSLACFLVFAIEFIRYAINMVYSISAGNVKVLNVIYSMASMLYKPTSMLVLALFLFLFAGHMQAWYELKNEHDLTV